VTAQPRDLAYGEGRDALLAATVSVAARKGLRGLTFRAVSEAAGVSNSLIAHYFGTRDQLLSAALTWSVDRSIAAADLSEYSRDIDAFRTALVESILAEPEIHAFQFEMLLEASRRPELRDTARTLYERYVEAVTEGRRGAGLEDSPELSRALFAALDGLMIQYLSQAISAEDLAQSIAALSKAIRPR
jgi:AcrR family transcriptional regulator